LSGTAPDPAIGPIRRRRPRGDHERRARRAAGARPGDHIGLPRGLPLRGGAPRTGSGGSGVDALPEGAALLVVKRGPNAGSRFLLDRAVTSAGRHPDSDIFLDDVTVSRRHAEFRSDAGSSWWSTSGSLNGTYVNREPVDTAVLVDGDEVQIGKFRWSSSRVRGLTPGRRMGRR
jgi:pSer/pThr/pTyr-binding forkhead associated (FHA) protein